MKTLLFFIISLLTINSYAYTPMVICGNRDLVLDKGYESRAGQEAQIVLKNKEIISYMISVGAIDASEINTKEEFIAHGTLKFDGTFMSGGYQLNMRGIRLTKRDGGYYLEFYINHYPNYDSLANFYFNNCNTL